MEIKSNNRSYFKDEKGLRFGVVVTLKEINGVTRIDDFIKNCHLSGGVVNKIDIKRRIDVYSSFNEDIKLL